MDDLISRKALLAEYDRVHIGPPGGARKLIEDAPAVQRWIPVSERLPKVRQRILVYCESKTIEMHVTACTYMGGYLGHEQFSRHVRNVTHWMPLPEPPKGE